MSVTVTKVSGSEDDFYWALRYMADQLMNRCETDPRFTVGMFANDDRVQGIVATVLMDSARDMGETFTLDECIEYYKAPGA